MVVSEKLFSSCHFHCKLASAVITDEESFILTFSERVLQLRSQELTRHRQSMLLDMTRSNVRYFPKALR